MKDRSATIRGGTWCLLAYLLAGGVALCVGLALEQQHPLLVAGAADLAATLVVFAFSVAFNNSSFYDAYWSVGPLGLAAYYTRGPSTPRQLVVLTLVALWGLRLTYNWWRGWRGLEHEDWRYVDIRRATGRLYWPVSLLGIHLMPTVMVFVGCLPLYVALGPKGVAPVGALDGAALVLTAAAIWIEARADRQLRDFVTAKPAPGAIMDSGLWALCRHPNYLGEILFWWGLYLFAIAADPGAWWTGGALAISVLFGVVSLPLIERRMLKRRPTYKEHCTKVPLLFPLPPRKHST